MQTQLNPIKLMAGNLFASQCENSHIGMQISTEFLKKPSLALVSNASLPGLKSPTCGSSMLAQKIHGSTADGYVAIAMVHVGQVETLKRRFLPRGGINGATVCPCKHILGRLSPALGTENGSFTASFHVESCRKSIDGDTYRKLRATLR